MFQINKNKGFSALPTLLVISMIIVEVAVISVVLANAFNNTRFSERLAAEAYAVARSGAQDGILKVIREKGCPSSLPDLTVGSRTAEITCTEDMPIIGQITIQSTGSAFLRNKSVEAVLGVSSETGKVSIQSFKEVAL